MNYIMKIPSFNDSRLTHKIEPEAMAFAIAEFLAVKGITDIHSNTYKAYAPTLRKLGEFTMGDLTDRKLLAYRLKVIDQDKNGNARSSRTSARMMTIVRQFLKFLVHKGTLATNYFDFIPSPKIDKHDSPYIALTDAQVRMMLDYPDRNTFLGSNQRLALHLAFHLGLRCSEICAIRYCDVDNGVLTIHGKGKKIRRIPLSETLQNEVESHIMLMATHVAMQDQKRHLIESRESQGYAIDSSTVWRWFKSASKICGIDEKSLRSVGKIISTHCARATAITKALDNGVGIREVSILAGHSSIETTAIYDKRRSEASKEAVMAIKY